MINNSGIDSEDLQGSRKRIVWSVTYAGWGCKGFTGVVPPGYAEVGEGCYGKNGEDFILKSGKEIYRFTRDYKVLWKMDASPPARGIPDYSQGTGRLICPNKNTIYEIDYDTGEVIKSLTLVGGKKLGWVRQVKWDVWNEDRFWLVDTDKHWVALTDMDGRLHDFWGEYGVPGGDDTHLNSPSTLILEMIHTWTHKHSDFISIADAGNERIIRVDIPNRTVEWEFPIHVYTISMPVGGYEAVSLEALGTFWMESLHAANVYALGPPSNIWIPHPKIPWRALGFFFHGAYEYDFDFGGEGWIAEPKSFELFDDTKAIAGTPVTSVCLPDWFRTKKAVFIKADQPGTVNIEIPRFGKWNAIWSGNWEIFESLNLTAHKLSSWLCDSPLAIFRVKVTLNTDGKVCGWVNLSP